MKKCPFCAEEIQDDALKCKHCGEFLNKEEVVQPAPEKWYFKNSTVLVAFLCVGPLALPLVWFNPRYNLTAKITMTISSIIITYFMAIWTAQSLNHIIAYYKQLGF